jgi:hypothetical protein
MDSVSKSVAMCIRHVVESHHFKLSQLLHSGLQSVVVVGYMEVTTIIQEVVS